MIKNEVSPKIKTTKLFIFSIGKKSLANNKLINAEKTIKTAKKISVVSKCSRQSYATPFKVKKGSKKTLYT